jgi:peroxiredoxin Q/BCP
MLQGFLMRKRLASLYNVVMIGVGMFGWLFQRPLPPGAQAPNFTLKDQDGKRVTLSELRGKNVVLIFYPGDDTPVCRRQLCDFRDRWEMAREKNTLVFGVNPQSAERHTGFRAHNNLPFPLLVDKGQRVGSLYNAAGLVPRRTVYLIGGDGRVRYSRRGRPPAEEVLAQAG